MNQKFSSLAKIGFKYNEFVENAQNEESAIYFKGNKFGEDVPIKKTNKYDKYCTGVEEGVVTGGGGPRVPPPPLSKVGKGEQVGLCRPPPRLLDITFVLISLFAHNLWFEMQFLKILFIKYFPNLANLKLKNNFSYILL